MYDILTVTYDGETLDNLNYYFKSIYIADTTNINKVVLVLDGPLSSEKMDVIREWSNKIPLKIVKAEKMGLSKCLNYALSYLESEYIARADTDDQSYPGRFEFQYSEMMKNNVDVHSCAIHEVGEEIDRIRSFKPGVITKSDNRMYFVNEVNHNCSMFRLKSVLDVGGYPIGRMEDFRLWVKMLNNDYTIKVSGDIYLEANVQNLHHRRVGGNYRKAEIDLFYSNLTRSMKGILLAGLSFFVRYPLRFSLMSSFLRHAHTLQRKVYGYFS